MFFMPRGPNTDADRNVVPGTSPVLSLKSCPGTLYMSGAAILSFKYGIHAFRSSSAFSYRGFWSSLCVVFIPNPNANPHRHSEYFLFPSCHCTPSFNPNLIPAGAL